MDTLNNQFLVKDKIKNICGQDMIDFINENHLYIDYIGFYYDKDLIITTNIKRDLNNGYREIRITKNDNDITNITDFRRFGNSCLELLIQYKNYEIKIYKKYDTLNFQLDYNNQLYTSQQKLIEGLNIMDLDFKYDKDYDFSNCNKICNALNVDILKIINVTQVEFKNVCNIDIRNIPSIKIVKGCNGSILLSDQVEELYLGPGSTIYIAPCNLKKLVLHYSFNNPIPNLPYSLEEIVFGYSYNKSIDLSKTNIKRITFGEKFSSAIKGLPDNLEELYFGTCYRQELSKIKLPNSIKILVLGEHYDCPLPKLLPLSLKKLVLGKYFNKAINQVKFPEGLEELVLGDDFNRPIKNYVLPSTLKIFKVGYGFKRSWPIY